MYPLKNKIKVTIFSIILLVSSLACEPVVENLVGPSFSGFTVGVTSHYGANGIAINTGTATIRVEVVSGNNIPVDGAAILLSATIGTLSATDLTTVNGVATATLTAPATAGTAYITATVENATATTAVPILAF